MLTKLFLAIGDVSLGNDSFGIGSAFSAGFWSGLAEKALKIATTPSSAGGMAMMLVAAFVGIKLISMHRDPASKLDLFDLRWIVVPLIDLGLFVVGAKLLFF